ncbi:hypothetical protein ACWGUN_09545 [Streptomyces koyangensis]
MAEPSSGDFEPYALFDVAAYAARVRAGAEARGGHFLLGVDGPGASGKSTLAGQLARHLPEAHVVHVDDFYLPSADRPRPGAQPGAPVVPGFDLRRLRNRSSPRPRAGSRWRTSGTTGGATGSGSGSSCRPVPR